MIQDIYPHRYRNEYKVRFPENQDHILFYEGRKVLVKWIDEQIHFPTFGEIKKHRNNKKDDIYLFQIDEVNYFLGKNQEAEHLKDYGYTWEDPQIFRYALPKYQSFAGVTGWQLNRWYDAHRFCGKCGSAMIRDGKERMMRCPECGNMEFPKICPAAIIAVTDGDRILMSKYAGREFKKYALLAGFNEIGETMEDTVRREVMEEVGLRVKNITYYKSQPWGFTDTLLMGFFCELDGDDHIILDEEELAIAEWFERDHMPVEPDGLSLTNEMMMIFKNQNRKDVEKP